MRRFIIIGSLLAALSGLFVGTASATSLSGLGAPPVNNTNCWARDGFGFVEVSCQYGTPYTYAQSLYAHWIGTGQVVLTYDNWPTAAGQPNGTTAYHDSWTTAGFNQIDTTTSAAFTFSVAYYKTWVDSGAIVVCTPGFSFCT